MPRFPVMGDVRADLYLDYARRCRERAETCAVPALRRLYCDLAKDWDELARIWNRLARDRRDYDACRRQMHAPADPG
jgi:hypothetical protein